MEVFEAFETFNQDFLKVDNVSLYMLFGNIEKLDFGQFDNLVGVFFGIASQSVKIGRGFDQAAPPALSMIISA